MAKLLSGILQSILKVKKIYFQRICAAAMVLIVLLFSCSIAACKRGNTLDAKFIDSMSKLKECGDDYSKNGLELQAGYYYSFAGSGISSLRLAVEKILSIKGKASASEKEEDEYRDWDTIAAVNYASPYPYYFEGLIYQIHGDENASRECFKYAVMNPNFPQDGISFYYLNGLSVKKLNALREKLIKLEKEIYSAYTREGEVCERSPMNFSDQYLRALAKESLEQNPEDYETAEKYYYTALKVNPFDTKNFAGMALLGIYTGDMDSAIYYVNEGLCFEKDDKALNSIADAIQSGKGGEAK